jgi:TetR/AcrR family fatty acid metabolism transcriptional regulator
MKTKQQVVLEFRRKEIVDAARSVFARKGFANGIMDDVAKEAGVAKGTLYLYFRSKTEIYRAVLGHDMELLKKQTVERIQAAHGLREKIRALILTRLEYAEQRREFFEIMDSHSGSLSLSRRQYRDWLTEPVQHLASAIDDAVRRGEIRAVPTQMVAWIIVDVVRGMIQRRLLGDTSYSPVQDADFLTDFLWTAIKH